MDVNKAILEELKSIGEQITHIENRVIAIDLSITGDDRRGVVGIKQHIKKIQEELKEHTENDQIEFEQLNKAKNILWGVIIGVPTISGGVAWLVSQLSK